MEKLIYGGIYSVEWDNRPMRVLIYNKYETIYDCYWPELDKWTFTGSLNGRLHFYRTSTDLFLSKSKQIDILPFTDEENKIIRPDLPLSFCRVKNFSFKNMDTFIESIDANNSEFNKMKNNKIVLLPITKRNTIIIKNKKIIEIITIKDLLYETKLLQELTKYIDHNGIGFYRSGLIKKLPSYYIGEYKDLANLYS